MVNKIIKVIQPRHTREHKPVNVLSNAKSFKARGWNKKLIVDPKGYFLIKIERRKIYAGRVNKKNHMVNILYGENAEDIYQEIIKRRWVSRLDHAAYLGKELNRAEYCLRSNKKYIQV